MATQLHLPGFPTKRQPTIRYDGMDWPLETFLDAYGFHRTDHRSADAIADSPVWLMAVLTDGSLIVCATADALPWGDVLAVRGSEHTPGNLEAVYLGTCDECGEFGWTWSDGFCESCDDYGI